jgi:hypothetical protein
MLAQLAVVDIEECENRGVVAVRTIRNRVCKEALSYPVVRILPSRLVFLGLKSA